MLTVQPVDLIASNQLILANKLFITYSCISKLLCGIQLNEILFQVNGQRTGQKIIRYAYFTVYKTINEFTEDLLQEKYFNTTPDKLPVWVKIGLLFSYSSVFLLKSHFDHDHSF